MVGSVPMLTMGLYSRGMDPHAVLFWRYWLALSILVPLAVATSPGLATEWRSAGRGLFINGITLGVLQTFTYFRAIQTMPSSIVVTIFFTYPLFAVIIDQVVFGRKARLPTVLAVLLILIGVALTGWPHLSLHEIEPVGLACATPHATHLQRLYRHRLPFHPSVLAVRQRDLHLSRARMRLHAHRTGTRPQDAWRLGRLGPSRRYRNGRRCPPDIVLRLRAAASLSQWLLDHCQPRARDRHHPRRRRARRRSHARAESSASSSLLSALSSNGSCAAKIDAGALLNDDWQNKPAKDAA